VHLPSALNVKVKELNQARVNGRSDYVSLKVAKCLVIQLASDDAHEWMNEIPTVPIYYLANPQPREWDWKNQRGKKTLLSLTLVQHCEMTYEV
jgi:phosphoribosylformylglycinamidine (FGAM) synthase PurS component